MATRARIAVGKITDTINNIIANPQGIVPLLGGGFKPTLRVDCALSLLGRRCHHMTYPLIQMAIIDKQNKTLAKTL